jgi:hypothetical protein
MALGDKPMIHRLTQGAAKAASLLLLIVLFLPWSCLGDPAPQVDLARLFAVAENDGRVGVARKTKIVDIRPAKVGEIVVTVIKGEGKETQSPPAEAGDFVVRNRCPETGNEELLLKAAKLADRYEGPIGPPDKDSWAPYRPRGVEMSYFIVRPQDGRFTFVAPWGELMVARPKDAIVRSPTDAKDIYRVASAAFKCTYEVLKPPNN